MKEQNIITWIRRSISLFDEDIYVSSEYRQKAHEMFSEHLMEWSEDFCVLYNKMQEIHRKLTPSKVGHYKNRTLEIGYSSFSSKKWIEDKKQSARCPTEVLLQELDTLVSAYKKLA